MTAKKPVSPRALTSDLKRVDTHSVRQVEYDELPELDDAMLARATVNRGGALLQRIHASCYSLAC